MHSIHTIATTTLPCHWEKDKEKVEFFQEMKMTHTTHSYVFFFFLLAELVLSVFFPFLSPFLGSVVPVP